MVTKVAGKLVVEIVGDASGLIHAYRDAQAQTETFEGQLKTMGDSLTRTGQKLTLGVTAPLTIMGGLALHTAASFDDSMRQVQAVTGATGDQFDKLRQQAIDLGAQTAWSASESAEAQKYLAKAGLEVNEVYAATPQMLSLASAGVLELGAAADISTNILSGFNLEISELGHVSDMLAQAASTSNTSVQQLGDAMAYVGPVASAANQQIEQTTAAIQIMSNAGIQGSMAGTALRGSISALLTPTTEARDILASYGLTAKQVNPELHSLSEIVQVLGDANLSTADAMAIFGDRAGPGMIALLTAGAGTLEDYTSKLEDCDGAAEKMAATMEGGVGGSLRELEGSVETLSITFGDLIAEAIMPMIEGATELANWLSGLDENTQKAIVSVGLFAAAVGPATWALGSMAGGVSSMITLYRTYQASTFAATVATKGFTAAIAANPIGLAVIGLTSLAAVLIPLIGNTEDATKAQDGYNEALEKTVDLTRLTNKEIQEKIDTLKEEIALYEQQIEQIDSRGIPAFENNTQAIKKERKETVYDKLAKGELTGQIKDVTECLNDETQAHQELTAAQHQSALAAKEKSIADAEAELATYEHELALRSLAAGAEEAYGQATKSVDHYRGSVKDLQDQYDELKKAIDRALSIDEDIDDSGRDVERADIQLEKARQNLADVEKEIAAKKVEMRSTDYGSYDKRDKAEKELADLELKHREAVLDLADAEDRYTDALEEQQKLQEEKTQVEKDLNGESVASAQEKLTEIGIALEEETNKLKAAQEDQKKAKIAHENIMNQIDLESLGTRTENWAKYVEFTAANPAIAETYHVDYDTDGNPSYIPQIKIPTIIVPEYSSLDLSQYEQSANETQSSSESSSGTQAASSQKAGVVIENLTVVSPKSDAATMAFQTQKVLRDIGSRVSGH